MTTSATPTKVGDIISRTEGGRAVRLNELAAFAEQAIDDHENARQAHRTVVRTLAVAIDDLTAAEKERARRKLTAITRICGEDHPATPGKKFSASAADDFAQIDSDYASYKEVVSDRQQRKLRAEKDVEDAAHAVETARLRAELAIAAFRVEGGLR